MMDIEDVLLLWFIRCLIKKTNNWTKSTKEIKLNQQLAEELHKPTIKKKIKRRAYSSFKNHNWGADLADIQLVSKFN